METVSKLMKVGDLKPNLDILRLFPIDQHTQNAVQENISENGMLQDIWVGSDGVIIDGHTRHASAVNLKMKEVPVKVFDIKGNSEEGIDFALRTQIGRRNLTTKQKLEKVALTLELHARWSDRKIATQYGVSPTTVGKVRATLKKGGKITEELEREDKKGRTMKTGKIAKNTRNRASQKKEAKAKAKRLPSALLSDPELTVGELSALEFDVDQLNAINRWAALLGKYIRTNPKPVSKEQKKAEAEAAKAKAKAEEAARKAEEKAAKLLQEAKDLKAGKVPAKKAAKKAATKKAAPKKAAKKGRK